MNTRIFQSSAYILSPVRFLVTLSFLTIALGNQSLAWADSCPGSSTTINGALSESPCLLTSNDDVTVTSSGSMAGSAYLELYQGLYEVGYNIKVGSGSSVSIINSGSLIHTKPNYKNFSIWNATGSTISTLTNNVGGTISSTGNDPSSIFNQGTMNTITNFGSITAATSTADSANAIDNEGTIVTIINQGTLSGSGPSAWNFGISNYYGSINNLSNRQNNLTYLGNLPTYYNIIVNSPSDYGKTVFSYAAGHTTFGIYPSSVLAANTTYASVIVGLTSADFSGPTAGTFTSGSTSYNWLLQNSSANMWDLIVGLCTSCGPSATDTQASLHNSAQRMRSVFNTAAISTNFANMNTYDCNLFDTKGMCISAGGRYTTVDNPNSNSTSAMVVVGYKATPNIRIGGFLDQNVSNNTPAGIRVSNKNPLMGIFAVWNQNADGLGYQVKVANAYQDKDVSTTRDVIGTSEAGTGTTNLNTQSYVGELSYAFRTNQDKTTLRPYLALRQTTIKQNAYTETGVANPLSYGSLKDRSTTALVGLKLNHALTPKATLTASLGIEQDLEHSVDQYSATSSSIANLTSENFNDSIKRTRPVASAGAYYAVSETQRISGDVFYQQLPFQSTGSTTAYFSYMIGL